jgi:hypothetical protein
MPGEELGVEQLPPPPVEEVPFNENHLESTEANAKESEGQTSGDKQSVVTTTTTTAAAAAAADADQQQVSNPPFLLDDQDQELIKLTEVLRKVHQEFFTLVDAKKKPINVKDILMRYKSAVLAETTIAFSGLVPVGHNLERWVLTTIRPKYLIL